MNKASDLRITSARVLFTEEDYAAESRITVVIL